MTTKPDPFELLDSAWGLIANAGNGDWSTQTVEWQGAAVRWRDQYGALAAKVSYEQLEET